MLEAVRRLQQGLARWTVRVAVSSRSASVGWGLDFRSRTRTIFLRSVQLLIQREDESSLAAPVLRTRHLRAVALVGSEG